MADDANTRTIFIDNRLSSYEVLMKDPAGSVLFDAGKGTPFEEAVFDLVSAWRRIDYARVLPFVLATSIPGIVGNAIKATSDSFPEMILREIMIRMGNQPLARQARKKLEKVVKELHTKAKAVREVLSNTYPFKFQAEEAWQNMLEARPFCLGLAASEQAAYTGLYFAYECFLARTVEAKTGTWPGTTRQIGERFLAEFGEEPWRDCWDAPPVRAARHARDAFAHRGGRVNADTASFAELLHVEGRTICVSANETRELFTALNERVVRFLRAARPAAVNGTAP